MLTRLLITVIFLLACGGGPRISRLPTLTPTGAPAPATAPTSTSVPAPVDRSGQASKDLGFQSGNLDGSSGQARELLKLIEEQPGKADYQIIYQTSTDTVLFACNFEKQIVFRLHQTSDNHGTQEVWEGYVLERLQAAAGGGSLNDTPEGKIPVIMTDF